MGAICTPIRKVGQGRRLSEAGPVADPDSAEQSLSPCGQPSPGGPRCPGGAVGRDCRGTPVAQEP